VVALDLCFLRSRFNHLRLVYSVHGALCFQWDVSGLETRVLPALVSLHCEKYVPN
jgi:hypothetical protein